MTKLDLRRFQADIDFKEKRELFSLSFPETIGTAINTDEFYQWKFQSKSSNPTSYHYVARGGKLLGSYSAIPYNYIIEGRPALCGMVCDVMTHPDARGKGIFTKLGAFATESMKSENIDFVSGYPIRKEVIPGHLKVGWFIAFKAPMYISVLKTDSLFKKFPGSKIASVIANKLISISDLIPLLFSKRGYRVSTLAKAEFLRDARYPEFFEEWASQQQNYLVKDKKFLEWRTGTPGTDYQFHVLEFDSIPVGIAISRTAILEGVPCLALLDLMILKEYSSGSPYFMRSLRSFARKNNLEVLTLMISSGWYKKYRLYLGCFIKTPAIFSVIFKLLNDNLSKTEFTNPENWHLTWLDCDDL